MPTDINGREIRAGNVVRFLVGIPGREVVATIEEFQGRLFAVDGHYRMSLARVLRWYNVEKVKEP